MTNFYDFRFRTSLMSSFLFHQQYPACFVRINWIVCEMSCSDRTAAVLVGYEDHCIL